MINDYDFIVNTKYALLQFLFSIGYTGIFEVVSKLLNGKLE